MARRGPLGWPNQAAARTIVNYSAKISDPVERLRYVHACRVLTEQKSWFLQLRPIGAAIYRVLGLGARFRGRQARRRRATAALSAVFVCAAAVVVWFGGKEPESLMEAAPPTDRERAEVASPHGPTAEIWHVESSDGADLYSNGLRVDNRYRAHTGPRVYAVLPRDGEVEPEALEWRDRPVGLVFHTTESDLAPFAKVHNHHIRYQGRQLLLYTRISTLVSVLLTIGWTRTPLFMRA